jgi:hypothetical protein
MKEFKVIVQEIDNSSASISRQKSSILKIEDNVNNYLEQGWEVFNTHALTNSKESWKTNLTIILLKDKKS